MAREILLLGNVLHIQGEKGQPIKTQPTIEANTSKLAGKPEHARAMHVQHQWSHLTPNTGWRTQQVNFRQDCWYFLSFRFSIVCMNVQFEIAFWLLLYV